MILSPHILTRGEVRLLVIMRHPEGESPSGVRNRHDVVHVIGELDHVHPTAHQLLAAHEWIASHNAAMCQALPGFGHALRKLRSRSSRDERARMIRRIRSARDATELMADPEWPKLRRALAALEQRFPKSMRRFSGRGKKRKTPISHGDHPTPEQIYTARILARMTQAEAAACVHASARTWEQWEAGERRMHAAFWELFKIKTNQAMISGK
ncbi:MAG TPA: hypothetical protein VNL74_00970 [Methylococcus sp.]|nr:hypothetical protein [Methylococcus sp.]